ncbi:hypothetical protein OHV05_37155 (plasmid) [Kitasatospora sp. NBC_00070]|uniref:hypothetical protein n=1 Tax=Kitasatospora sp. NBC_00070 TaxID=2975962 RepID=UPI002F918790
MTKTSEQSNLPRTREPLGTGIRLIIGDADGKITMGLELSHRVFAQLAEFGNVTVLRDDLEVDVSQAVANCEPRVRFLTLSLPG